MITFKSTSDLSKLHPSAPAYPLIKELVDSLINAYTWPSHPYLPDDYGYIILIEEGDTNRVLHEIWDDWKLIDIPWEGITKRGDFYLAIMIFNDDGGYSFVLPDAEWVNGELRRIIEDNLDP